MKYSIILTTILLFTTISAAQPTTQIDIQLKNTEPTPLQTSQYADIWLEVTNRGSATANNVEVNFTENYPFSVDPGDRTHWELGELVPGEQYQIRLEAKIDENAVQGSSDLVFYTSTGERWISKKVPVEIRSDNNILSIESVNSSETIAPGNEGTYSFELRNRADGHLKNIRVELGLSESNLPVATKGSSAQSFESLAPGETLVSSFRLQADDSADNAVYRLPVDLTYENEAGTEFEDSITTSLRVGGEPRLEAGITNDELLQQGRNTVNLRVVNRGYGTAGFVQATLEESDDYRILSPQTVYLGEMTSDDYQTAEFTVYVEESGTVSMPLRLDYSDNGEKTVVQNIEAEVYSQDQLDQYGLSSGTSLLPVALIVLLIAGGAYYYWRRRKKE